MPKKIKKIQKIKQLKVSDVPEIREKLLKEQNYICPICLQKITDPCLDHHHKKRIKNVKNEKKKIT
jgi:hypothetical protein